MFDKKMSLMTVGLLAAMAGGMTAGMPGTRNIFATSARRTRRTRPDYPTMAVSTHEEIEAHNAAVATRQVVRRSYSGELKATRRNYKTGRFLCRERELNRLGRFHAA